MSIFGIRLWLARVIPRSLTIAIGAGIGLFIGQRFPPFLFTLLITHANFLPPIQNARALQTPIRPPVFLLQHLLVCPQMD